MRWQFRSRAQARFRRMKNSARLFNNKWYQVQTICTGGSQGLQLLPLVGFGNDISAQSLHHFQWMRQWRYLVSIYRLHLVDKGKNISDAIGHFSGF